MHNLRQRISSKHFVLYLRVHLFLLISFDGVNLQFFSNFYLKYTYFVKFFTIFRDAKLKYGHGRHTSCSG